MTYAEKLRDPRWQKKRLEILQRDNKTCRSCSRSSGIIQVHHMKYIFGREPWDYSDSYLVTLCKECHQNITYLKQCAKDILDDISDSEERLVLACDILSIACNAENREQMLCLMDLVNNIKNSYQNGF